MGGKMHPQPAQTQEDFSEGKREIIIKATQGTWIRHGWVIGGDYRVQMDTFHVSTDSILTSVPIRKLSCLREPFLWLLSVLHFKRRPRLCVKTRNPICYLLSDLPEKERLTLMLIMSLLGKTISPPFPTFSSQLQKRLFRRINSELLFKLWDSLHF